MNTQKLIQDVKARFKHNESKLYLQEKYRAKLTFTAQNGMWTATPEFLAFLTAAPEQTVIVDNFGNPVKVDTKSLLDRSWEIYTDTMDHWHQEYSNLQNFR